MRTLLLLTLLSPSLAQAAVDFKCDSVRYEDQVSGWIRFGANGHNGHVNIEYWNGYPPITLVDADLDNGTETKQGMKYESEADRHNGTVATLDTPDRAYALDKFVAKIDMRYKSPENGKMRISKYDLNCVRH